MQFRGWKLKTSQILNFRNSKLKTCSMPRKQQQIISSLDNLKINQEAIMICPMQYFDADFL